MANTSIALVLVTDSLDDENAVYEAVQNFVDIYEDRVDSIAIIGPRSIDVDREIIEPVPIARSPSHSKISNIFSYIQYQLRIARKIWEMRSQFDLVFFHIGGTLLLFPLLATRLSDTRSLIFITGSASQSFYAQHGQNIQSTVFVQVMKTMEKITGSLADEIILLSDSMNSRIIPWLSSTTIRVANVNHINCSEFQKETKINDRKVDITFVGRLESVKGVQNIVRALPDLVNQNPDLRVEFIGDGRERKELEKYVEEAGLDNHVTFTGWIERGEIPNHLNNAQILLMPSTSEGVPKTILEAMSCGTIPIATPVGGIPDIISENKTGFFLSGSDPKTIAKKVEEVLEKDDLDNISNNAREYIEDSHSYEFIKREYIRILTENEDGTEEGG